MLGRSQHPAAKVYRFVPNSKAGDWISLPAALASTLAPVQRSGRTSALPYPLPGLRKAYNEKNPHGKLLTNNNFS
jgi:hypothetical protein